MAGIISSGFLVGRSIKSNCKFAQKMYYLRKEKERHELRYICKRSADLLFSLMGLILFSWLIAACWIFATIETRSNGFFRQERVGRHGKLFKILKIKTMYNARAQDRSTVTTSNSPQITKSGKFFRQWKLDELPQLWNVLIGDMSFVGPRPDVPGFADALKGEDRIILTLRPGITGPASIAFKNEEAILAAVEDPEAYNAAVIWPKKIAINREYAHTFTFWGDIRLILRTFL